MKHSHSLFARLLALLLLATVLFARLAVAGYVCPQEAESAIGSAAMGSMASCPNMDHMQPALCADHQHDGRHWADNNGHSDDLGALPAPEFAYVLPRTPSLRRPLPTEGSAIPSPEPLYLATARLRI